MEESKIEETVHSGYVGIQIKTRRQGFLRKYMERISMFKHGGSLSMVPRNFRVLKYIYICMKNSFLYFTCNFTPSVFCIVIFIQYILPFQLTKFLLQFYVFEPVNYCSAAVSKELVCKSDRFNVRIPVSQPRCQSWAKTVNTS